VKLQRRSLSVDDHGGQINTWIDIGEVWADLEPVGGTEKEIGTEVRDYSTFTVTIRYFAGLTPKDRVLYHDPTVGTDRIFNITNINNMDERNHVMELAAQEGLNLG
jgi:SPP1 family predicted phage head-tail adaptor